MTCHFISEESLNANHIFLVVSALKEATTIKLL